MLKNPMDLSEVQDFSMGNKNKNTLMPSQGRSCGAAGGNNGNGKGKLNDMLSKLMGKNKTVCNNISVLSKKD